VNYAEKSNPFSEKVTKLSRKERKKLIYKVLTLRTHPELVDERLLRQMKL
jgi:hypothetical protein